VRVREREREIARKREWRGWARACLGLAGARGLRL
jgi:hypothetical protein